MTKSLPRKVKVGFRVAMASQPFNTLVTYLDSLYFCIQQSILYLVAYLDDLFHYYFFIQQEREI